jgi:hypothetical protein
MPRSTESLREKLFGKGLQGRVRDLHEILPAQIEGVRPISMGPARLVPPTIS